MLLISASSYEVPRMPDLQLRSPSTHKPYRVQEGFKCTCAHKAQIRHTGHQGGHQVVMGSCSAEIGLRTKAGRLRGILWLAFLAA